jgi:hypothetical protein
MSIADLVRLLVDNDFLLRAVVVVDFHALNGCLHGRFRFCFGVGVDCCVGVGVGGRYGRWMTSVITTI